MSYTVTYPDFVAQTPIESSKVDQNFADAVGAVNTHEPLTTGVHGVGAGALVGTTLSQTITNKAIGVSAITSASATTAGWTSNLGITLSGGVLSITDISGSTLSASNPGYVTIPSATGGQNLMLNVVAAPTLQDATHGTPQILGRWGTTASVAWGSPMPVYIGVVKDQTDATTVRFFWTRNPAMTTTPASTNNIGIGGTAPVTSSQTNIVLFGTAANTDYNSKPCIILGSLQITIDNSAGGSATIGTLVAGRDGFGLFQEGVAFNMVVGQNGAVAGEWTGTSGPSWATNALVVSKYWITRSGRVRWHLDTTGAGNATNGGDGATTVFYKPYATVQNYATLGTAYADWNSVGSVCTEFSDTNTFYSFFRKTADNAALVNNGWAAGSDIQANVEYQAF